MTERIEVQDSMSDVELTFDPQELPAWAIGYVTPKWSRTGRVALDVGPYVGAIPLTSGGTLYVVPRAGRSAFVRMLVKTEGLENVDFRRDEAEYGSDEGGAGWLRAMARPFTRSLRRIEKESLAFGWARRTGRFDAVRGRIEPVATAYALDMRADNPVACTFRERTRQTPENRLLGSAAARLLSLGLLTGHDNRAVAARWAKEFGRRPNPRDLVVVVEKLGAGRYDGPRSYYEPALAMARLITAQAGLGLHVRDSVRAESLLVDVNRLFEQYVRRTISDGLTSYDVGKRTALKAVGSKSLYTNGDVLMDPDVFVVGPDGVRVVVDVKYKPTHAVTSSDHYQMASYLRGYDAGVGIFIRPTTAEHSSRKLRVTVDGRRVVELAVPLREPREAERIIVDTVRGAHRLARILGRR